MKKLILVIGFLGLVSFAYAASSSGGAVIGAVSSANITDDTIVDADVNSAAAITATKVGSGSISNAELDLLDGHTATLVDTNTTSVPAVTSVGTLTSLSVSGAIVGATINTGNGAAEVINMDQAVLTTSTPTFSGATITYGATLATATVTGLLTAGTINTGQGATEVYLMNQDVKTTNAPSFYDITATYGFLSVTGTVTGLLTAGTINTGQGATEVYLMDQHVKTTSAPSFYDVIATYGVAGATAAFSGAVVVGTLDTGQGANELYDMDQNVQQADAVTFATVNTGQGAYELYSMNQNVTTTSAPSFYDVTATYGVLAATASFTSDVTVAATKKVSAGYFQLVTDIDPDAAPAAAGLLGVDVGANYVLYISTSTGTFGGWVKVGTQ